MGWNLKSQLKVELCERTLSASDFVRYRYSKKTKEAYFFCIVLVINALEKYEY
jgi:hypothetical protein